MKCYSCSKGQCVDFGIWCEECRKRHQAEEAKRREVTDFLRIRAPKEEPMRFVHSEAGQ